MANRIGTYMENHHTKFIKEAIPTRLDKPDPAGRTVVTYEKGGEYFTDEYDTVLFAIGRYALTKDLNLEKAGVVAESNWKIRVNDEE
jgi:thioredoxin reductase (NADPH)